VATLWLQAQFGLTGLEKCKQERVARRVGPDCVRNLFIALRLTAKVDGLSFSR